MNLTVDAAGQTHANDATYDRSLITNFFKIQASVKYIYQCTLNSASTAIAWCADDDNGQSIHVKYLSSNNDSTITITAADSVNQTTNQTEPAWSPGGKEIAFLSDAQTPDQLQIFIADAATGKLISTQPLTHFNGYVSHLRWSPDGKYLSVLYVENASRNPSPMAAENKLTGLIDSAVNKNVQRIVIISKLTAEAKVVSPPQLYIFKLGWSYGGAMAMFSITQTNRFKAAVAGAGACNWQSYYGQNSIDKWMMGYFGASPYVDANAYAKVSAITYITKAKTPTLILVGERDGEAPPAQSFEFWHALKELQVPTQLFVYPGEGHSFENFDDMIDVSARTIEWFNKYLAP